MPASSSMSGRDMSGEDGMEKWSKSSEEGMEGKDEVVAGLESDL